MGLRKSARQLGSRREGKRTHDQLERSLERRAEGMTDVVRILEHVAQPTEERLDRHLGFDEVDEDVVGFREEDVVEVTHDEHRRLRLSSLRSGVTRVPQAREGMHAQRGRRSGGTSRRR